MRTVSQSISANATKSAPRRKKRATCKDCFFYQAEICALDHSRPCPTFRIGGSSGPAPALQMSFPVASERRHPAVVAFRPPPTFIETDEPESDEDVADRPMVLSRAS